MKIGALTGGCTHAIASPGGMLNDHRGVAVAFLVSHLERNAVHYGARCLLRSISPQSSLPHATNGPDSRVLGRY